MPEGVRETLSSILVLHPVAALLVLIMFIMAVTSHFHAPAHSARYLLAFFVFTIITFLVCLGAFIIDVLLFIPNLAWGSYIVLASTIMVLISGVVTCAMRRSLISRKNRRKKIAENAEMSGENYYNREAGKPVGFNLAPPVAVSTGANGNTDALPAFATFEESKKSDQVSDEQIPLTSRSPSSAQNSRNEAPNFNNEAMAMNAPARSASRDRYGNPTQDPYGVARGPSMESMRSRGSQHAYRGRGGYGPGRGGYDMYGAPMRGRGGRGGPRGGYGPPRGRGGYGPPPHRGGPYGPGPMRGGHRSPPPGPPGMAMGGYYDGAHDRRDPPAEPYGPYGRRPSDGYTNPSTNPSMPSVNDNAYEPYNPSATNLPRAESPPPMTASDGLPGQAIEMDATPVHNDQTQGFTPYNGQTLRDNDSDVGGMVALQQGQQPPNRHDTYLSEGSKYSQDDQQYLPARQAWTQGEGRNSPRQPSPLNVQGRQAAAQPDQGNYYEDVDPRFASNGHSPAGAYPRQPPNEPAYEDVHAGNSGARSPAESERSTFTSISQRGVNPQWNPPPPMPHQGHRGPSRRPAQQQRQDMILDNADFQLPGGRAAGGGGGRTGPGMVPGSAYPTGPL